MESVNQVTIQYVQREDGTVEARELHTVLNSLRHAELEPQLQGGGWALWSRGRGSEHGWSHQERSAIFDPVPWLHNLVHPASRRTGCKIIGTYGGWVVHTCGASSIQDSHSGVQVCCQHHRTSWSFVAHNGLAVLSAQSSSRESCGACFVRRCAVVSRFQNNRGSLTTTSEQTENGLRRPCVLDKVV